jgi:hypothetical protein
MEGSLMEKMSGGTISSKWRTRWCRVDSHCFYFGESKDSVKVNTIPLAQIRELKLLADPKRFDMVLQDDSVQAFLASSKGEAKRWVRVIKEPLAEFAHVTITCPLARGVMAADANGFSDPFCDLLVIDANGKQLGKMETPKIMKTLDPVWDHVFYVSDELPLPPSEWANLTLRFEVYDWDAVGSNDFLGQVKIPLSKVPQGSIKQEFYTLEPGQGITEVTGQIKLGVCWETPDYIQKKASFQFGRAIQALPSRFVDGYNVPIPEVLLKMQDYLYTNGGLQVVGIFRLAPDEHAVDEVKAALNESRFKTCADVNCVAHLLKVWFRDLPNRLMENVDRAKLQAATCDERAAGALVSSFVDPQATILSWLIDLCVKVASHEDSNKMNSKNLAIVFAPNLGPRIEDPTAEHQLIQHLTLWMDKAIQHRQASGPEAVQASGPLLTITKIEDSKVDQSVEELVWSVLLRQLSVCSDLGMLPADLEEALTNLVVKTATPASSETREWIAKSSPGRTPFFFNPATGETAWSLPAGGVLVEGNAPSETADIRPSLIRPKSTQQAVAPDNKENSSQGARPGARPGDADRPNALRVATGVRAKSPNPALSRTLPQTLGSTESSPMRGSLVKSAESPPMRSGSLVKKDSDDDSSRGSGTSFPPLQGSPTATSARPPPRTQLWPAARVMRGLTHEQSNSFRDVAVALQALQANKPKDASSPNSPPANASGARPPTPRR